MPDYPDTCAWPPRPGDYKYPSRFSWSNQEANQDANNSDDIDGEKLVDFDIPHFKMPYTIKDDEVDKLLEEKEEKVSVSNILYI